MSRVSHVAMWLLMVAASIIAFAPQIASAKTIKLKIVTPGEQVDAIRVLSHRESARSNQVVGRGAPALKLTIFAKERGKARAQLRFESNIQRGTVRLQPSTSGCVFATVGWDEPGKLKDELFLPAQERIELCPGRDNALVLERQRVALSATVVAPEDEPYEGEACIEYFSSGAWQEAGCAPIAQQVDWAYVRKIDDRTLQLRSTVAGARHPSSEISFDIAPAARGEPAHETVPLGEPIWRTIELRLPRRALRGWESHPTSDAKQASSSKRYYERAEAHPRVRRGLRPVLHHRGHGPLRREAVPRRLARGRRRAERRNHLRL